MLEFKKNDIAVIMVEGETRKLVRLNDNIKYENGRYTIPFSKMWEVIIRPVPGPRGMGMDRSVIPTSSIMEMMEDNCLFISDRGNNVVIGKLNPLGDLAKELMADTMNMILPA